MSLLTYVGQPRCSWCTDVSTGVQHKWRTRALPVCRGRLSLAALSTASSGYKQLLVEKLHWQVELAVCFASHS